MSGREFLFQHAKNRPAKPVNNGENTPHVGKLQKISGLHHNRCNKPLFSKLAKNHTRFSDPKDCIRPENTSELPAKTLLFSKRNKIQPSREPPNKSGDSEHVGKRSNKKGPSLSGSVFFKHIFNTKEGAGSISTHYKSKGIKLVHSISKVQDGNFIRSQGHSERGGLHVQKRSQGCILLSPNSQGITKICKVSLAGDSLRVPMSDVWSRPSPKNFHKTSESSNVHFKKTEHTSNDLYRRYNCDGLLERGNRNSQELSDLSVRNIRVHEQLQEICAYSNEGAGVLRSGNKLCGHDFLSSDREGQVNKAVLSVSSTKRKSDSEGGIKPDRETGCNSSSIYTCPITNKISPEGCKRSFENIQPKLRGNDGVKPSFPSRIRMVAGNPGHATGEAYKDSIPRPDDELRCSKREKRGLGSPLWGGLNRGPMGSGREEGTYKYFGTESSFSRNPNLPQGLLPRIDTSPDRQHSSPSSLSENGETYCYRVNCLDKENLRVPLTSGDHSYSRIHSLKAECRIRFPIPEYSGQQRVDAGKIDFQEHHKNLGPASSGSICLSSITPNSGLFQLETRSTLLSSQCTRSKLAKRSVVCVPTICSDRKVPAKDQESTIFSDSNRPGMGKSALVSSSVRNAVRPSEDDIYIPFLANKSPGANSPSLGEQISDTGSLVSVRGPSAAKRLSSSAKHLIANSKAQGTRKRYGSAWGKFNSWCGERELDPISTPITEILNFLSYLYDSGLEYSTINGYRSALSFYRAPIDGFKVGEHPDICKLVKGISRERPPLPKYVHIWDVEKVLNFINNMPKNEELSLKDHFVGLNESK